MTLPKLLKQVRKLVLEVGSGRFSPILEADVVGFLYHLLISNCGVSPAQLHLDTRVSGARLKDKYDLAIGKVVKRKQDNLLCIFPEFIIEAKLFPIEFSNQQHREHFLHVLEDDLQKLGRISSSYTNVQTIEFLYDEKDYLSGKYKKQNRLKFLLNQRALIAPTAKIILARKPKTKSNWLVQSL